MKSTLEYLADPKHFAAHMKRQAIDAGILTKKGKPFKHGGKREGAGRPALPEPHERRNVYLSKSEWAQLERIDPSPSHAIRKLLKPAGASGDKE